MDLSDVRDRLNYIIGEKKSKDHLLTPADFNNLLRVNNLKHFKKKVGLPEAYRIGLPLPPEVFEQTRKNSNDLRPFKVVMGEGDVQALRIDSNGFADIPPDLYYPSSILYKDTVNGVIKNREVDIVTDMQWLSRIHSNIKVPTRQYPVANFRAQYIAFEPRTLRYVTFIYLRFPLDPVFAVTSTEDSGTVIYNATDSVQLEWDDINIIDIISLILEDIGISIAAQEIMAYSDKEVKEGI